MFKKKQELGGSWKCGYIALRDNLDRERILQARERILQARDTNTGYLLSCQAIKIMESLETANFISGAIGIYKNPTY